MTWIQTATGKRVDYRDPDINSISRIDIAMSLDRMPRFHGNLNCNYTVADHSLNLASILPEEPFFKLQALLHDAAEAYMMDIPSPLKKLLGDDFARIERTLECAIFKHFDVDYPLSGIIKKYDAALCRAEAAYLGFHKPIDNWHEKISSIKLPIQAVQMHDKGEYLEMLNYWLAKDQSQRNF
jgi:hypothetical protein